MMLRLVGVSVLMVSVVTGCTTQLEEELVDDLVLDTAAVIDEGVIVGDLDWQEAATLPAGAGRTAANAAGYVSIPSQSSRCSGFLVGRDVVMTNNHCVPDAASAVGVVVNFRYETRWDTTGAVRCERFLGTNVALDYTLIGCEGFPGDTFGVLNLDSSPLASGTAISLLHQQCDYFTTPSCVPTKKLSPGTITGTRNTNRITHDADMLGGSSGGAIVKAGTSDLVAINNAHVLPPNTNGRGTTNVGVPMSLIVPDLLARFPSLFASCEAIGSAGRVIGEDDACVTLGGPASSLRAVSSQGHDDELVWTGTTANSTAANFAEWSLQFSAPGRYEVAVFIDDDQPTATRARYRVTHAGGTTDVTLNQAAPTSSGFVVLGAFDFGARGTVRLGDNTGDRSQHLVFDALRVLPATTTTPPTTTPPTPPAATCSAVRIVNADSLNVRPDPNTSRAAIGVLPRGEVISRRNTVAGQTVRGTNSWYLVEKPGLQGYISAAYATCVN